MERKEKEKNKHRSTNDLRQQHRFMVMSNLSLDSIYLFPISYIPATNFIYRRSHHHNVFLALSRNKLIN
jgi:hypothetical protein